MSACVGCRMRAKLWGSKENMCLLTSKLLSCKKLKADGIFLHFTRQRPLTAFKKFLYLC